MRESTDKTLQTSYFFTDKMFEERNILEIQFTFKVTYREN